MLVNLNRPNLVHAAGNAFVAFRIPEVFYVFDVLSPALHAYLEAKDKKIEFSLGSEFKRTMR